MPRPQPHARHVPTPGSCGTGSRRLLLRHQELQRTNALLEQQLAGVTQERDNLRSRLNAAREPHRCAAFERLPAEARDNNENAS